MGFNWVTGGLSVVSTICAIIFGYFAFSRNRKHDDKNEASNIAAILSDLGYVKAGNDEIKTKFDKMNDKHHVVVERVTLTEASTKQAHKRIDDTIKSNCEQNNEIKEDIKEIRNDIKDLKEK